MLVLTKIKVSKFGFETAGFWVKLFVYSLISSFSFIAQDKFRKRNEIGGALRIQKRVLWI